MWTFLQFLGSVFTQALGLNNDGEVVGSYVDSGGVTHGFTYSIATETYTSVDAPEPWEPQSTHRTALDAASDSQSYLSCLITESMLLACKSCVISSRESRWRR